jgi:pilus assembly protein CpaE
VTRILLATASAGFEQRVRAAYEGAVNGDVRRYWREGMLSNELPQVVEELTKANPGVLAVGPELDPDDAVKVVRAFDQNRPEIVTVIVSELSAQLWKEALRAGARDVISPDASSVELRHAFDRALDTAERRQSSLGSDVDHRAQSRVFTVVSPKGGSGKTTVATNLAVGLAQHAPGEVVILDLDLQFGDVASALRLAPEHTIANAASPSAALDSTTLKVFLTPHPTELFALCAPESLAQTDDVRPEHLNRVMSLLVEEFRYVVIDTAAGIDVAALSAMERSTDILLVSTTDVPCVRGLRKAVEALDAIGLTSQTRLLLLNRADTKVGLGLSDIESAVGMPVEVTVPSALPLWLSLNLGTPILESDPGSPAGKAMRELVHRLVPESAGRAVGVPRRGGLFRRRKEYQ